MPEMNSNFYIYCLVGLMALFILLLLIVGFTMFLNNFSRELKYLNSEIERTTGAERRYWLRKRRRLWLSLIPFVKY